MGLSKSFKLRLPDDCSVPPLVRLSLLGGLTCLPGLKLRGKVESVLVTEVKGFSILTRM